MPITFDSDKDIIVYALEKIITYARDNQYIILAQSVWCISLITGLQQGLVVHIDNLCIRHKVPIEESRTQPDDKTVPTIPMDSRDNSRIHMDIDYIHPDRVSQAQGTIHDIDDLELDESEPDRLLRITKSTEQCIQKSWKDWKEFKNRAKLLSRTRSGKVIAKHLAKKQQEYLQ
jgi:hypothetical protein